MLRQGDETPKKPGLPYRTLSGKIAGLLLAAAGAIILMGIITAEALYPAPYDTTGNTISDLGGTMPSEGGVVLQPSAAIFDATMLASGPMIFVGACIVHRAFCRWAVTTPLALLGVGVLGVGIFPGNVPFAHPIFALGTVTLASIVLGFFFLDELRFVAALGEGGIERWIAYPVVLWLAIFGGYLMGRSDGDGA